MKIITFILIVFYSLTSYSQDSLNFKKDFTDAEFSFYEEDYFNALKGYKKLYLLDKENANINYRIGVCYLKSPFDKKKKISAISYLEKAVNNVTKDYREGDVSEKQADVDAFIYLGDAYFINGEIDAAIDAYETFSTVNTENTDYYKPITRRKIETCNNAKVLKTLPIILKEKNIGEPINNAYSNFNPIVSKDEKMLIYTSDLRFYKAIFYSYKKDGKWSSPRNFNVDIGDEGDCISLALSPDGTIMYVYKDDMGNGNIYSSKYENEKWGQLIKLNKNINSQDLENSVSLSDDGQIMYFSSNRKGGYGSLDIYKSEFNTKTSEWGKAINLGSKINSEFDEMSPFVIDNGKKLYFSSQGHHNIGGYDIFISELRDSSWTNPINLGYPINTTDDNFHFFPLGNGSSAYYQIATEEGFGSNDIYFVEMVNPKSDNNITIKGNIKPNTVETKIEAFDYANLKVLAKTSPDKDGKYILDVDDGDFELIFESETFEKKSEKLSLPKVYYTASIDVSPELTYKDLLSDNTTATTKNSTNSSTNTTSGSGISNASISGSGTTNNANVTISNFIFEFDKHKNDIVKDDIVRLAEYLKTNTSAKIQINAYADLQGHESYNIKLSERRANFVKNILVNNGVNKKNIAIKAFGEEKQISIDLNPETRKYNRRVEFIVVSQGTNKLVIKPLEIPKEFLIK